LRGAVYAVVLVLFDDFLNALFKESIERGYLLGDKTVLLKVRLNHFPRVFNIDCKVVQLLSILSI